jgi:hypothetical protein
MSIPGIKPGLTAFLGAVFLASPAFAYVGPGAGVGMLGSILGLLIAFATIFGIFALIPFKAIRNRRRKSAKAAAGPAGETLED